MLGSKLYLLSRFYSVSRYVVLLKVYISICILIVNDSSASRRESWGKCYNVTTPPSCNIEDEPWFDITQWGDTISVILNWNFDTSLYGDDCNGTVTFNGVTKDMNDSQIAMVLTEQNGNLVDGIDGVATGLTDLKVESTDSSLITTREKFGDFVLDVRQNLQSCGYNKDCGTVPHQTVNFSVENNHSTEERTLRLTISRNFDKTGDGDIGPGGGDFSEITGISAVILDQATNEPIGLPHQISKNWHVGSVETPYDAKNFWWTVNMIMHLPPSFSKNMTLVLAYEKYHEVSAFSHSQLSTIGYSFKHSWLWEQAALGSGGENFVMDPLGEHTRAVITDVRVKWFDGAWTQNNGGGDYLLYFDGSGVFRYKKELTAQIRTSGPCLSDALYTSISDDGAIKSKIRVSGGRTDDLVRVFIHVQNEVLQDTSFSRLAFFQMGSETYNYNSDFENFAFGSGENKTGEFTRDCNGGTLRASENMYTSANDGTTYNKVQAQGSGPWWFAFDRTGNQTHTFDDTGDRLLREGDRGLIVRKFDAVFNGVNYAVPSFSILCDKLELGPPAGLNSLQAGDYVDMHLEFLVIPREIDMDSIMKLSGNSKDSSVNSNSLTYLRSLLNTTERVKEHAKPIKVQILSPQGSIQSDYPIRVEVPDEFDPETDTFTFRVIGGALGFVPIVISGLSSSHVPDLSKLWSKRSDANSFTAETDATIARQVNYLRDTGRYELVFNVEMLFDTNEYSPAEHTDYAFGAEPQTQIII